MYDYVIVGAGSAGCVLAARLSADPACRVLLLEAGGPDRDPRIRIPAAFSRLFKTEADWNHHTEPQAGAAGRSLYWPMGKVLGGSSSINAMIYVRGHQADYDGWAAQGCEGWGFSDVLPYFKRSEDNARGASAYHGVGGPLRVEDPRDPSPHSHTFVAAAVEAGFASTPDFNGPSQEGAGLYQLTQKGGRRHSAAEAFLRPAMGRTNLEVRTGASALRVVFDGDRAAGVEYLQDGLRKTALTRGEVILSGGAVHSPHLLLLSGVGPESQLQRLGISVVADRAGVGENLHDHLIVGAHWRLRRAQSLLSAESPANLLAYLIARRGMLASNVAEAGLFTAARGAGLPDLQFHVAPALFENHGLVPQTEHGVSMGPTLVRPASRGRVTLRTADPLAAPAIDPNYLAEQGDVDVLVEGVRIARQIAAQPAYRGLLAAELKPGPRLGRDSDLAAYVRQTCETLYHPVGTCRMGADADAVVDTELRVRGVRGLRVVDASVMPVVPNGNTNAPTIMIAERAADLIRGLIPRPQQRAVGGDGLDTTRLPELR
ncbi:MAG TPA: GMC family oxidoreductase N-terminal domain-containing protein [Rhodothermales bacterium]|nr:GMC family oxidoreductase N-terminal domain-containing protein [Rhodothermales bacterium]